MKFEGWMGDEGISGRNIMKVSLGIGESENELGSGTEKSHTHSKPV